MAHALVHHDSQPMQDDDVEHHRAYDHFWTPGTICHQHLFRNPVAWRREHEEARRKEQEAGKKFKFDPLHLAFQPS